MKTRTVKLNPPTVTPADAVKLLNQALKADPKAMHELVETRASCNNKIAGHPTIQCAVETGAVTGRTSYSVGLVGILNGIFGCQPGTSVGFIAARFDRNKLVEFEVLKLKKEKA